VSFTSRPLYPRAKNPEPVAKRKKSLPYRESNPGRPVRNLVTVLPELSQCLNVHPNSHVKLKLSLVLNKAQRHEDVLGSGDIAPRIL
jgi:hypothetical protein